MTKEEIEEKINQAPYFEGFEDESSHELLAATVEVGEEYFYSLPIAIDKNDDEISLIVEPGDHTL